MTAGSRLDSYRSKRDADRTPEPREKELPGGNPPIGAAEALEEK